MLKRRTAEFIQRAFELVYSTNFLTLVDILDPSRPLCSHSPQSAHHKEMPSHSETAEASQSAHHEEMPTTSEMAEDSSANEYSDSESMSDSDSKYVISLFQLCTTAD